MLEVNSRPSFRTDTPIDKKIKKGVIKDAFRIMKINPEDKIKYIIK